MKKEGIEKIRSVFSIPSYYFVVYIVVSVDQPFPLTSCRVSKASDSRISLKCSLK